MTFIKKARRLKFNNKLIFFLVLLYGFEHILLYINAEGYLSINATLLKVIKVFFISTIAFLIVSVLLRLTVKKVFFLFEKELEIEQRIFMTKIYSFVLYSIPVFVLLWQLGVSLDQLTLIFGLMTTGIAFAIRDLIVSFFAWLIILSKKPFRIGDYIKVGDDTGLVDRIGTFFVTIKNEDQSYLTKIPNKILLDKPVQRHNRNKISSRLKFKLAKIPKDFGKREKAMESSIMKIAGKDSKPDVFLDVDASELVLVVTYYVPFNNMSDIRTAIIQEIYAQNSTLFKNKK